MHRPGPRLRAGGRGVAVLHGDAATDPAAGPRAAVPVVERDPRRHRSPPTPPPVRLVVPDVGIDMAVDPVGVRDDGEMEIPEDADRAGWYRFGPAPADPAGATVVAAHVDSVRGHRAVREAAGRRRSGPS